MPHIYNVTDFKYKISVLAHLFGKESFLKEGIKEPTFNLWLNGGGISRKNALLLCRNIGLSIDDLELSDSAFVDAVIVCYANFTNKDVDQVKDKVTKICNTYNHTSHIVNRSILHGLLSTISKEYMKSFYQQYKNNYYFCYMKWIRWNEEPTHHEKENTIYKLLMKVTDYDEENNEILTQLTSFHQYQSYLENTDRDVWGFHGTMLPSFNCLHFVYLPVNRTTDQFFVYLITTRSRGKKLRGILSTESSSPDGLPDFSIPVSTRISLIRIPEEETKKGEKYLFE